MAALWMIWVSLPSALAPAAQNQDDLIAQSITLLGWVAAIAVGGLITERQPHNPYGWVWLGLGATSSFQAFALRYTYLGLVAAPGSRLFAGPILILTVVEWVLQLSLLGFALLLFPTGRLPSARWRPIAWIAAGATALAAAVGWALPGQSAFLPIENPYGIAGSFGSLVTAVLFIYFFCLLIFILLSVVSLTTRFRKASQVERQQLKWFAFAGLIFAGYLVSDFWFELPAFWESLKEAAVFAALPLSVGIAILRYRLFDIDIIIRKTLVYGVLTGLLLSTFIGSITVINTLLTSVTGPRSQLATVISTRTIAALFNPLRRRVQAAVDRRFYRQRYHAERALAEFSAALRNEVDLRALSEQLVGVVQNSMQPARVELWLSSAYPLAGKISTLRRRNDSVLTGQVAQGEPDAASLQTDAAGAGAARRVAGA